MGRKYAEYSHQAEPKPNSWHIVSGEKLECVTRSDTPQNMIMKTEQSPTKGKTRTRSGQIGCRLERLGIDTQ